MSLKDEIASLKVDFNTLQNFLRHRITLMEVRIGEIESKITNTEIQTQEAPIPIKNLTLSNQEIDNKTRNIIEELMWESTLSEAVLHVRETFKDHNSREKFLRCSFELVLEKDEQYRKMVGTLFGHLLNQNIVNQTNIFNSLNSVLLVIENNNKYDTHMWQNLTQILLPILTEGHIKLLQLQRKAQTILKHDYLQQFINHVHGAIDGKKKSTSNNLSQPTLPDEHKLFEPPLDLPNLYDLESLSKFKPPFEHTVEVEPHAKCDIEFLLNSLTGETVEEAVHQLKKLPPAHFKSALEEIIDIGIHKDRDQRILIGTFLVSTLSQNLIDLKELLTCYCNSVLKVERLIMNQKTRSNICEGFADIILPLLSANKVKLENLSTVASLTLSEETKTIFTWTIEKILNEKGIPTEIYPNIGSPKPVNPKLLKRFVKYMGKGPPAPAEGDARMVEVKPRKPIEREKVEIRERFLPEHDIRSETGRTENDRFLSIKRTNLLKERTENMGDRVHAPRAEDLMSDKVSRRKHDGDMAETLMKPPELPKPAAPEPQKLTEIEHSQPQQPIVVNKQPENLPSSAIKEKMEEIIEMLMLNGRLDECLNMIKDSFNECQSDLVFKAAFEYTKGKSSEHRIQCGRLISEAFKHDSKRIGAQIMNTISLELGDYEDTAELWNGMAEIISPPMINGLIRFSDLKLLPKYFLHTSHCASFLSAIFRQILEEKGPDWLEENWKKSKVELSTFLPLDMCHKFVVDNNFQFCVSEEELTSYKQNVSK